MREAGTLRRQGPTTKATQSRRPDFFQGHSLRATTETQSNDEDNGMKPVRRVADSEAGLTLL